MPKEEWGVKRICPTTGKRFYDLNKKPIISPYTGETVEVDANTKTRVAVEKVAKKADEPETVEDDVLLDDADVADPDVADDILEDDDDDTVPLEEIADVAKEDDDT